MPMLNIYIDDRTMGILTEYARRTGNTIEGLAEAAVADEAIRAIPPQARASLPNRERRYIHPEG